MFFSLCLIFRKQRFKNEYFCLSCRRHSFRSDMLIFANRIFKMMKMANRNFIKVAAWIALAVILGAVAFGVYLWNMPHRNVQQSGVFAEMQVNDLLNEFEKNADAANKKYLSSDGNSKVLVVGGRIFSVSTNLNNQQVILLKENGAKVGVRCTLISATDANQLKVGDYIKIKGAITAGNRYDADLDLYEDALLTDCAIVK